MAGQHLHGVGRIVLTANRQQDAAPREIEQGTLQFLESCSGILGAQANAVDAVFADDSAPKRVVQVYGDALGNFSGQGMQEAQPLGGEVRQVGGRYGQADGQPLAGVAPALASVARHQRVVVQDVDSAMPSCQGAQSTVDSLDGFGSIVFALGVQDAGAREGGHFQRMHNQGSAGVLAERGDPIAKAGEHVVRRGLSAPQGGRHIARLHGQDGDVRLKAVQGALRDRGSPARRR